MTADLVDTHDDLGRIALGALPPMLDSRSGLFSHKTFLAGGKYENRGTNALYSGMTLVGLLEQRLAPVDAAIPVGRALDGLHSAIGSSPTPSLLGVGAWACGLAEDQRGEALARALGEALRSSKCSSMDLALGLSGLVTAFNAYPPLRDRCRRWAQSTAEILSQRFSPSANLFAGSRRTSPRNFTQPRLTSFATQVYPLHALAGYAREISGHPPDILTRVARTLVDAQGPLGQWWWFYSTRSGVVLEGYPVYSVHQDSMAFMGLLPLGELGLPVPREALLRGLRWELGANELSTSLVRRDPPFIARCIQRVGSDADGFGGISRLNRLRLVRRALVPAGRDKATRPKEHELELLDEARPYHLGWLLYANSLVARMDEQRV